MVSSRQGRGSALWGRPWSCGSYFPSWPAACSPVAGFSLRRSAVRLPVTGPSSSPLLLRSGAARRASSCSPGRPAGGSFSDVPHLPDSSQLAQQVTAASFLLPDTTMAGASPARPPLGRGLRLLAVGSPRPPFLSSRHPHPFVALTPSSLSSPTHTPRAANNSTLYRTTSKALRHTSYRTAGPPSSLPPWQAVALNGMMPLTCWPLVASSVSPGIASQSSKRMQHACVPLTVSTGRAASTTSQRRPLTCAWPGGRCTGVSRPPGMRRWLPGRRTLFQPG